MSYIVSVVKKCVVILPLLLAACAISDVSTTPPPALTLNAPPSLNFSGNCNNSKDLENWLQITTGLVSDFQTTMNEAAGKNRSEAYQPTVALLALRDTAYVVSTPDCATDLELALSDAMNQAVTALQQFVNGTVSDVSSTIADINTRLDQITVSQNELIQRLNTQIANQVLQLTTTP